MPSFEVEAPNGKTYQVEGPEGATQEDAVRMVMQQDPRSKLSWIGSKLGGFTETVRSAVAAPLKPLFQAAGWMDVNYPLPWAHQKTEEEAARKADTYSKIAGDVVLSAPIIAVTGGAGSGASTLGGILRGGAPVLPKLMPALGRIAGSAAIGAGQAAEHGESPGGGALVGAAGGAVGEGLGAGINALIKTKRAGYSFLPEKLTGATEKIEREANDFLETQASNYTKRIADNLRTQYGNAIPSDARDLDVIRKYAGQALGKKMDVLHDSARALVGDTARTNPALGTKEYTIGQMLERLGKIERIEGATGDPFAVSRANNARTFIASWLNDTKPGAGTEFLKQRYDIQTDRRTIKALQDAVSANTGTIDPQKLMQIVNKMKGSVAPELSEQAELIAAKKAPQAMSEFINRPYLGGRAELNAYKAKIAEDVARIKATNMLRNSTSVADRNAAVRALLNARDNAMTMELRKQISGQLTKSTLDALLANPDTRPLGIYLATRAPGLLTGFVPSGLLPSGTHGLVRDIENLAD